MKLSSLANASALGSAIERLVPTSLKACWVESLCAFALLCWGLKSSNQNARLLLSPRTLPSVKRGVERIDLASLRIPNIVRNSYIQLGLLILSSKLNPELEPTRRECLTLRHSGGDQVLLDWFLPSAVEGAVSKPNTPIVVYVPGITGRSREAVSFVRTVLAKGWIAVVFHRRGHEDYLKRASFNIFGSARDLHVAIESIHATSPGAPVALVGSSAGSAVMVRYLGQYAENAQVVAGVGLSPGYDIHGMWEDIRGTFFDRYLTSELKKFFLYRNKDLLFARDAEAVRRLQAAESVQEFAQHAVVFAAEHHENDDPDMVHTYDDWLEQTCPLRVANDIRVPTLCVNALDDPICHRRMVETIGMKLPSSNEHCALLVTNNGSHCAHMSWNGSRLENWGHRVALEFIEGVTEL